MVQGRFLPVLHCLSSAMHLFSSFVFCLSCCSSRLRSAVVTVAVFSPFINRFSCCFLRFTRKRIKLRMVSTCFLCVFVLQDQCLSFWYCIHRQASQRYFFCNHCWSLCPVCWYCYDTLGWVSVWQAACKMGVQIKLWHDCWSRFNIMYLYCTTILFHIQVCIDISHCLGI